MNTNLDLQEQLVDLQKENAFLREAIAEAWACVDRCNKALADLLITIADESEGGPVAKS